VEKKEVLIRTATAVTIGVDTADLPKIQYSFRPLNALSVEEAPIVGKRRLIGTFLSHLFAVV
jgi:hypothetical protein